MKMIMLRCSIDSGRRGKGILLHEEIQLVSELIKGDVIIKRDKSILTGEKGYMNLNTRKSKIESSKSKRVKGVFSPIQK